MKPTEQKMGWFFLLTGAVAFVFLLYVESYRTSEMLAAYFGLSSLALSAVLTYDLFRRHDLTISHKTVLAVVIWIIPFANWAVFFRHRNIRRAN
jgi:hypothetical protein